MEQNGEVVLTNQEIADAKETVEYLRTLRQVDSSLTVDISRLYRELKAGWDPIEEEMTRLREELGEGPEGARIIKQGTQEFRLFHSRINEMMKKGAVRVSSRLYLPELVMKERNPETGARETVAIPLSSKDRDNLGDLLIDASREEHAKANRAAAAAADGSEANGKGRSRSHQRRDAVAAEP